LTSTILMVDTQFSQPNGFGFSCLPPVLAHAQLREREGEKDVDAVHDHQQSDVASAVKKNPFRGGCTAQVKATTGSRKNL